MRNKSNVFAGLILALMLVLMLSSAKGDSAIMDELAHIPAGFGYVVKHDFRLNPEHPPLLKAMAGFFGQIFSHPRFPTDTKAWQDDVNGQWTQGDIFLYGSGNDADKIIFWSRLPFMLLAVLFGWLIFYWVKKRFGDITAFLVLLLYAFSPTFLAHSRFVTTDLGAAFGFFLGIIAFIKFTEKPNWKNVLLFGLAIGLVQLLKFSLVLLIPMYAFILLVWSFSIPYLDLRERLKTLIILGLKTIAAGVVGLLLVWAVYYPFIYNEPQARQYDDAKLILASHPSKLSTQLDLKLIENNFTRPLGQYILGVLMVGQRAGGGNTGYFMGEVSAGGWRSYFPILYLVKEPLALHILTLIALGFCLWKIFRRPKLSFGGEKLSLARSWIYKHLAEFSALVMIGVYWGFSVISPLNIGVRHVLPTFPFIYLLVSRQISDWILSREKNQSRDVWEFFRNIYRSYLKSIPRYLLVVGLLIWLAADTIAAFPDFLSYYNELAGGAKRGYEVAVDSNYDWGQDLIRLKKFVEENKIDKIYVDYFGGGNPYYYLGEKFIPWNSRKGYVSGWVAVSATFRTQAFGKPVKGFLRGGNETYSWLKPYQPVGQAGKSIFLYKLP